MYEKPLIYLDTNHVSALVRAPSSAAGRVIRSRIERGEVAVGLSIMHVVELSAPDFKSRKSVGQFLNSIDTRWAINPPTLQRREVEAAVSRYLGVPVTIRAFFQHMHQAWDDFPFEAEVSVETALEVISGRPDLRGMLLDHSRRSARTDVLKRHAYIVRNRKGSMQLLMREYFPARTPSGLPLRGVVSVDDVLQVLPPWDGLPACSLHEALAYLRFNDEGYRTEPNDLIDEWHAFYGPYVDVLAVDRRTCGRIQATRHPVAGRTVHSLAGLLDLLDGPITTKGAGGCVTLGPLDR